MKKYIYLVFLILIFSIFLPFFSANMKKRPLYEKLGFRPLGKFYKAVLGEFRWIMGDYFTFVAITYYGGKVEKLYSGKITDLEYYNLYKTIETAVILNPYHEDAYYFAQAVFVWDVRRVREVNAILRYVFRYRDWDFQIPFFLGFNYAFFLKDYKKSAYYFKKAAILSSNPIYASLAARYFYETGSTELGIKFLEYMIKNFHDERIKKFLQKRLIALKRILILEKAVSRYKEIFKKRPKSLKELLEAGLISQIPKDPYGGRFYIDKKGRVRSTSNLAEGWKK